MIKTKSRSRKRVVLTSNSFKFFLDIFFNFIIYYIVEFSEFFSYCVGAKVFKNSSFSLLDKMERIHKVFLGYFEAWFSFFKSFLASSSLRRLKASSISFVWGLDIMNVI